MVNQYGEGGTFTVRMDGPFAGGGSSSKKVEVYAPVDDWKGAISPFSQEIVVDGVTANSKVDLQLDNGQLEKLRKQEIAFMAENEGGIVTLYAIGSKPDFSVTFQATLTEVIE